MELIAPRLEILPAPQRALWKELATLPRPFVLYGGTGLALQLGHRDSVDFDFFSSQPLDKRALLALPLFRGAAIKQDAENTLSVEVIRADEPVKFSFFGSLTMGRVENPAVCRDHGLKLASLLDIGGLKAAVVQKRAQAKDYGDVAVLIQAGVSLERMAGAAAALYPGQFAAPNTLRALTYFEDGDLPTLSQAKREVLNAAVREFRGVARIVRASTSMTLTESEGLPILNDLRARFTLAAADPSQREELTERAGWIGAELSGSQTRTEHKQWQALAQDLLERRPGFNPEAFVARAVRARAPAQGHER